jgi:hypothetical protein
MSDTVNPWQGPEAPAQAEENAAQGILTAAMIRYLKESSPWLRFVGILGYIGAAFLIISGIIMILTGGGSISFRGFSPSSGLIGLGYVPLGVLAFFPARFTYTFGIKIRRYLLNGGEKDLEEAFRNNRSLWKFTGVSAIVYLSFLPVGLIIALIAVVSGILQG